MLFDQSDYNVRFEWGPRGASVLAPISDVVIVVDVLSFCTSVEIATNQGSIVFPYRWKDESVYEFAKLVSAEVADSINKNGYRLSPSTLQSLAPDTRLVLPSPNGSEICLLAKPTPTIAGCLRNARAVAVSAMSIGRNIAVIPAGERWEDNTLRPCFEDLAGAGAIIRFINRSMSPEAEAAVAMFERVSSSLFEKIAACGSGKEKIGRHEEADLRLATQLDTSDCVPVLVDGAFRREL